MNAKDKLIESAYTFYPKGVSDLKGDAYQQSSVFRHMLATKEKNMETIMPVWKEFINDLSNRVTNGEMVYSFDYYLSQHTERSFAVSVYFPEWRRNLVLHISTLIPCFVIYESDPFFEAKQYGNYAKFSISEELKKTRK